jgi:Lon protease-like protein
MLCTTRRPRLADVTQRIPLFPLSTVLYPGLVLPLHIFEERYRLLVRTLMDQHESHGPKAFGVVAIRAGREVGADGVLALHDVGCTAELRAVHAYPDGRYDVETVGTRRFRLLSVDSSGAYLEGEVEWLDERPGEAAPVLAGSVERAFAEYRTALSGAADDETEALPLDPRVLSYLVAATMVLDLGDQQRLLVAEDTDQRLRLALGLLRRETAILRVLPSLPAVELTRTVTSTS